VCRTASEEECARQSIIVGGIAMSSKTVIALAAAFLVNCYGSCNWRSGRERADKRRCSIARTSRRRTVANSITPECQPVSP